MSELSKVAYQVMWNRLIAVVEEQAKVFELRKPYLLSMWNDQP